MCFHYVKLELCKFILYGTVIVYHYAINLKCVERYFPVNGFILNVNTVVYVCMCVYIYIYIYNIYYIYIIYIYIYVCACVRACVRV